MVVAQSTDAAWRKWGEIDPYFGVLTQPKYRKGALDDHRVDFFRSGGEHITTVLDQVRREGGDVGGHALDFGCGVGRLLLPLTQHYDRVTGVDISEAMLSEAKRNLEEIGARSFTLVVSDDSVSRATDQYDLVHSHIVLQHIPTERGYRIIDALLSKLKPGGAFYLHMTVSRVGSGGRKLLSSLAYSNGMLHSLLNVARGRSAGEPPMQMNEYRFDRLGRIFQAHGIDRCATLFSSEDGTLSAAFVGRVPH